MSTETPVHWEFLSYGQLDCTALYNILRARSDVFVIEQKSPCLEIDGLDDKSHHLVGWSARNNRQVAAYLRLVPPGLRFKETAITRVLTTTPYRKRGLAREATRQGLAQAALLYPGHAVRISAQQYLEKFYHDFGFKTVSEPYDDEGVLHVDMLLTKPT